MEHHRWLFLTVLLWKIKCYTFGRFLNDVNLQNLNHFLNIILVSCCSPIFTQWSLIAKRFLYLLNCLHITKTVPPTLNSSIPMNAPVLTLSSKKMIILKLRPRNQKILFCTFFLYIDFKIYLVAIFLSRYITDSVGTKMFTNISSEAFRTLSHI